MKRIAACFAALALAACATAPLQTSIPAQWTAHQQELLAVQNWTLNSRISLRSGGDAWQGVVRWDQEQERYTILFRASFGQSALQLSGDRGEVVLELADGRRYVAADAASLVRQELGWSLPLENLRYWVRGLPAPAAQSELLFDAQGRLAELHQDDWRVEYRGYATVNGFSLPDRIAIHGPEVRVQLAVDRWDLPG